MSMHEDFQTWKGQLRCLADQAQELFARGQRFGLENLTPDWLEGLDTGLQQMDQGTFSVAYVGQMKAGKSALVNAMVFHQLIVPVGATPVTARLTRITYCEKPGAIVRFCSREEWAELEQMAQKEEKSYLQQKAEEVTQFVQEIKGAISGAEREEEWSYRKQVQQAQQRVGPELPSLLGTEREIALEDLPQYVAVSEEATGQGKYAAITKEVEIRYPFRQWPQNIEFVDTPGTNDPDALREKITLDYLTQADAVILVLYAGQPASREDLLFLKEKLLPVGPDKVILVLNKFDQIPEQEGSNVQEYLRAQVQQAMASGEASLPPEMIRLLDNSPVYPVSGLRALLARSQGQIPDGSFHFRRICSEKGIHNFRAALEHSGIESLESALKEHLLKQKGMALLDGPVRRCRAILHLIQRESQRQTDLIQQSIQDVEKSLEDLVAEMQELERQKSELDEWLQEWKELIEAKVREEVVLSGTALLEEEMRSIEKELQQTYLPRIDQMGRTTIDHDIGNLNVDLAWRLRGWQQDLERLLTDRARAVTQWLKDEIKGKAGQWIDRKGMRSFQVWFDQLAVLKASVVTPEIAKLHRGDLWWTSLQLYPFLNELFTSQAMSFCKRCRETLPASLEQLQKKIRTQVEPLLVEARRYLQDRVEQKKAIVEEKRSSSDGARKQEELQARRANMARLQSDAEQLLSQLSELKERSSEARRSD